MSPWNALHIFLHIARRKFHITIKTTNLQCLFRINYISLHYTLQDTSSSQTTSQDVTSQKTDYVGTASTECENVENKRFIKTAKMMVLEEIEAATPSMIVLFNVPLTISLLAT